MQPGISLIVGLGNPGQEYAETRHNAGFRFLGAVSAQFGAVLRSESRFTAEVARITVASQDVWLLAPMTFMNRSGESVSRFSQYYKIPRERILVAYDELDLQPGVVRLKRGGGAAGHNGIIDIIEKLGSPDFYRLRIGVGRPPNAGQGANYVLKRAPASEQALIDDAIARAAGQLAEIVQGQFQKVMNVLHADPAST